MDKLSVKESSAVRTELYDVALSALNGVGYDTEAIKGGALIHLPNGYFAKMSISVADATKFSLEEVREEYQAQLKAREAAAAKAEAKALEKAEKEKAKLAKEAAKETE